MKTHTKILALAVSAAFATALAADSGRKKAPPAGADDFVAHEWGTFTSVQGADGVQMGWNPFVAEELPKFVFNLSDPEGKTGNRLQPGALFSFKSMFVSKQRMETPVIYFYSQRERQVDVEVKFPSGRITEWYPQVADPQLMARMGSLGLSVGAQQVPGMRWVGVQLRRAGGEKLFKNDSSGSHYYAARATDSVPLRVKPPGGTEQDEKFLFYRGVAQFEAPLTVTHHGEHAQAVSLHNRGKQAIRSLFVYAVRGDRAAMVAVAGVDAGGRQDVAFEFEQHARPLAEVRAALAAKMREALVREGLFEKEAAAMVKTWDDSWFAEQGTRVLYALPRQWADEVLPLTITPAPKAVSRVFVGRAEMITPAMEWAALREIVHYAEGDEAAKSAAVKSVKALGLGRFAEPVFERVRGRGPQVDSFWGAAGELINALRPPPPGSLAQAGSVPQR